MTTRKGPGQGLEIAGIWTILAVEWLALSAAGTQWVDLGSSLTSASETWEDRGDGAQEEGDEVDETEQARQAGGDTADVAGQGGEAALCCINVISI